MTAEEWLSGVLAGVRRLADEESRLRILGKWPDGMPRSAAGDDMAGVDAFLDDRAQVSSEVSKARVLCRTLDVECPHHKWGRILECFYCDDMGIRGTAAAIDLSEPWVKQEKSTALDVATDRFFSPRR